MSCTPAPAARRSRSVLWGVEVLCAAIFALLYFRDAPDAAARDGMFPNGFLGGIAVLFGLAIVLTLLELADAVIVGRIITVTADAITLPDLRLFSRRSRRIAFVDVRSAGKAEVAKQLVLRVRHVGGEIDIPCRLMRSDEEFEHLFGLLLGALEAAFRQRQGEQATRQATG